MIQLSGRQLVLVPLTLLCACSYQTDGQMSEFQNFAVFDRRPDPVLEALMNVLTDRSALTADLAPELRTGLVETLRAGEPIQFSSESVALNVSQLADLVPQEYRRFIGEEGGRYVLEIGLEPAADGGIRVSVNSTLIATVRGGEGPLGGRPLPSNGTLERSILDALRQRLGD